jgi:hypothetical protein
MDATRRHGVFLLAILVCGWAASTAPAYEVVPTDLALVPDDAVVVLSVRCAAVAEKLGLDTDPGPLETIAQAGLALGLRGADVERITVVFHTAWQEPLLIVRTVKPVPRRRLLAALGSRTEVVSHGKQWQADKTGNFGVYFADDHTFAVGEKDSIPHCLDPKKHDKAPPFAAFLADADKHDAVAWSAAVPLSDLPSSRPCCSASLRFRPAAAETVVSYKRSCGGNSKAAGKKPRTLFMIPLGLPEGMESASATVDLGEEVIVEGRLTCADAAAARQGEKLAHVGLDAARMLALMMEVELTGAELAGEKPGIPETVTALLHQGEAALQATRIVRDGNTLTATAKLPMNAGKLAVALRAAGELVQETECPHPVPCCPQGCATGCGIPTTPYAISGPPAVVPSVPIGVPVGSVTPATPVSNGVDAARPASTSGAYATPSRIAEPLPPQPAAQVVQSYPSVPIGIYAPTPPQMIPPATQVPGSPTATGCWGGPVQQVGTGPAPAPVAPPAPVAKFTVANVKKEPALLFTEGEGGKLTFVRKVPAGEAVDLDTSSGCRWIAVFSDKPAGTAFTVGKPGEVVLLR